MRNLPATISSLPTKPFLPPTLSIGTDICHIPRILRLLTRSTRPRLGWQFTRKIMGDEELRNCRHVFESSFERVDALRRSKWRAETFRKKLGPARLKGFKEMVGAKGGGEGGEVAARVEGSEALKEVLGKGVWEFGQAKAKSKAKTKEKEKGKVNPDPVEDEGEVSKEGLLIGVLRSVVNWKIYNEVEELHTPWSVLLDGVKGGKTVEDVTDGAIDALRVISGKDLLKDSREEAAQIQNLEDTLPEVDITREQVQDIHPVGDPAMHSEAPSLRTESTEIKDPAEQPQSEEQPPLIAAHAEQTELPEGLREDITVFLEIEAQLLKHLSQAEALLQEPAVFLAGRFAAKEAIMKAHQSRRLTYHDIVILKQPPNDSGSQAPLAFVLGEREAREVRFSISHDGEYATATALVHEGDADPGRASAVREEPMVVRRVPTRSAVVKPEETSRNTVNEEPLKVRKVTTTETTPPIFLW